MSPDLAKARPCEECGAEAGQPCYPNCTSAAEHEPVRDDLCEECGQPGCTSRPTTDRAEEAD